jgi:pimeloyl-ACP methyl ester carboxylesterase
MDNDQIDQILSSEWVDYKTSGSKTLLITFSPVDVPKGRFAPFKAVQDLPYSILRFNNPSEQWYVGGIPETDLRVGGLEKPIEALIKRDGYERIAVFGGSMGGFGALDIGLRINSDIIIATGAETIFGSPRGYAAWRLTPARITRARFRMESWRNAFDARRPRVYCIYGEVPKVDLLFASKIQMMLGIMPVILGQCGHSVPQFIERHYKLGSLISNLVEAKYEPFIAQHRIDVDLQQYMAEVEALERMPVVALRK